MLVIPVSQNLNWRNPPYVTLGIIGLCFFVFFVFQRSDNENHARAIEYYQDSGLLEIELKYFVKYTTDDAYKDREILEPLTQEMKAEYCFAMMSDDNFIDDLVSGKIITRQNSDYNEWHRKRIQYDSLMQTVVSRSYGFIPAVKEPITYITYMFIHGSFGHLVGNAIFLWLVGCILEIGCGRIWFTLLYLLGGIAAMTVFGLSCPSSHTPCIGASGAISAVMGALPVFFGMKKIKVFFSLGIYFDYLSIFAIILLPFWLLNEFAQLITMADVSNVAYMAHIGGLAGGAVIGAVFKQLLPQDGIEMFVVKEEDSVAADINKAVECIGRVDMAGALDYLEPVLLEDPHNLKALKLLANIHKHNNQKEQYDTTVKKLVHAMVVQSSDDKLIYDTCTEYIQSGGQAVFTPELYCALSIICIKQDKFDEARDHLNQLVEKHPGFEKIPLMLLAAADLLAKKNRKTLAAEYYNKIIQAYPAADEVKKAQMFLTTLD